MIITKKIKVSDEIIASGGFADIRSGKYKGQPVAVKIMRVTEKDNTKKDGLLPNRRVNGQAKSDWRGQGIGCLRNFLCWGGAWKKDNMEEDNTEKDGFLKIRKVRINDIFSALGTRSQPLIPSSNFARKSFSGARYLTRTS